MIIGMVTVNILMMIYLMYVITCYCYLVTDDAVAGRVRPQYHIYQLCCVCIRVASIH
jgi:hypothetical protein